jgi:hypothetical protein
MEDAWIAILAPPKRCTITCQLRPELYLRGTPLSKSLDAPGFKGGRPSTRACRSALVGDARNSETEIGISMTPLLVCITVNRCEGAFKLSA